MFEKSCALFHQVASQACHDHGITGCRCHRHQSWQPASANIPTRKNRSSFVFQRRGFHFNDVGIVPAPNPEAQNAQQTFRRTIGWRERRKNNAIKKGRKKPPLWWKHGTIKASNSPSWNSGTPCSPKSANDKGDDRKWISSRTRRGRSAREKALSRKNQRINGGTIALVLKWPQPATGQGSSELAATSMFPTTLGTKPKYTPRLSRLKQLVPIWTTQI